MLMRVLNAQLKDQETQGEIDKKETELSLEEAKQASERERGRTLAEEGRNMEVQASLNRDAAAKQRRSMAQQRRESIQDTVSKLKEVRTPKKQSADANSKPMSRPALIESTPVSTRKRRPANSSRKQSTKKNKSASHWKRATKDELIDDLTPQDIQSLEDDAQVWGVLQHCNDQGVLYQPKARVRKGTRQGTCFLSMPVLVAFVDRLNEYCNVDLYVDADHTTHDVGKTLSDFISDYATEHH